MSISTSIAIGVLVVIGAIGGGVAGDLTTKKQNYLGVQGGAKDGPSGGDIMAPPGDGLVLQNTNILNTSRIASSNWTDPDGYIHRRVFFQDTYDNMIQLRGDGIHRTGPGR